jgi:hypothetical protein
MNDLLQQLRKHAERSLRCDGQCECGGQLVPHPWRKMRWVCERSHWWNRRKHAYLVGQVQSIEIVRRDQ